MGIRIGRLWHHPVKSMRGEAVDEVALAPGGLVGDRAYGLVDVESGRILSAKRPKLYGSLLDCHASFVGAPQPDAAPPPIRVTMPDGTVVEGSVTDGEAVGRAVSAYLGREVRLISAVPEGATYDTIWPELNGPSDFLGALRQEQPEVDGEPLYGVPPGIGAPGTLLDLGALHVLCASTLAALAAEHPDGVWDDRRFRPNIVFDDGPVPHDREAGHFTEDDWIGYDLRIGDEARIHIVAPTLRCPMPSLPQAGELPRDTGILRTLNKLNRRQLGELGSFPTLGAYAEVVVPGVIRTGDPVTVSETAATESPFGAAIDMLGAAMRAGQDA